MQIEEIDTSKEGKKSQKILQKNCLPHPLCFDFYKYLSSDIKFWSSDNLLKLLKCNYLENHNTYGSKILNTARHN